MKKSLEDKILELEVILERLIDHAKNSPLDHRKHVEKKINKYSNQYKKYTGRYYIYGFKTYAEDEIKEWERLYGGK